jgi:hypothetical protein
LAPFLNTQKTRSKERSGRLVCDINGTEYLSSKTLFVQYHQVPAITKPATSHLVTPFLKSDVALQYPVDCSAGKLDMDEAEQIQTADHPRQAGHFPFFLSEWVGLESQEALENPSVRQYPSTAGQLQERTLRIG